jgi:hypothetical protein
MPISQTPLPGWRFQNRWFHGWRCARIAIIPTGWRDWCIRLIVLIGIATGIPDVRAHGLDLPRPEESELAKIQPPVPGADVFARALFQHLRNRLDARQTDLLDEIGRMLFYQDQIAGGFSPQSGPRDAEYYRWQMERRLLELMEGFPDLVTLDFRAGRPSRDRDETLGLDQQYNLVVLKTITGDGPARFAVQDVDLLCEQAPEIGWPEGFNKRLVRIGENAVTYSLLVLSQVPPDKTILHLAFQNDNADRPHLWQALTLLTTPFGNFGLALLDDRGEPTPAMVRLTSKAGHRPHEPAGAIDLRPIMNEVTGFKFYGPGRGYRVQMPGPFAGHFWYVPEGFEMALPTGEWDLDIFRGLEFAPVHKSFRIEPGGWTRETVKLFRHTDMPARGWYSGDDHTHARLMTSEDADKLVTIARAADIHVCNVLEMGDWMRSYYPQRGFGKDFRVRHGDHWVIPGQEDPRSLLGHAIGLNLSARVRDLNRYLLNDWWAGEIHKQGGLYGHTHVGAKACLAERQMAIYQPMGIVDFNSIQQTRLGTDYYYDFLNMGFKMTATSGEDMPYTGVLSASRLYAWCGTEQSFDPDRWFDAVKRGHTFVTTGPLLDLRVEDAMPGDEITVDSNRKLKVTAKASGLPGHSAPEVLRLVKLGETALEQQAMSAGQAEIELSATLDAGHGFWLAAYAKGRDGSEAITTPVYVVRKGFRFWNPDKATQAIDRQLAVLDETETALRECETTVREGRAPLDYWSRWGAEQAGEVRVRMDRARHFYQDLRETLKNERGLRGLP